MERSGTVDKAVRALEALHSSGGSASLAELAARLRMPKATLHRLLASLAVHALVEQDGEGRYRLGVGLIRLGLGAQALDPVARVARPELEQAARAFGETFFLVAARGGRLVVLDKAEGTGLLRAAPTVGAEVPVDVTASGRLYLAHAPELVGADAGRAAPRAVQQARKRGYDVNEGEWINGLTVIAAPVLARGGLHGCVACAAASPNLRGQRLEAAVRHTRDAAESVARSLQGESKR
ncbi:IclR family transcriptional regulator [Sorangium cellulosum]|uniref:IclR family transcriptional regulator n=1 Tax=Sorangium cellulosum TaxID=56 RepID=A0A2L0EIE6_SORCE|nr:IclR family transcriptional regulator [Sorangium cellulosum]AUX39073.1 IclR family transcriptional regulator [Sorangium cellulosum]